jgi:hypothetical protein
VQRYAPEINKHIRPYLRLSGMSYRVDETYIKVGKTCKYLYRAVDKQGRTIEFMRSAKRDVPAAKRFFKKMMRASCRWQAPNNSRSGDVLPRVPPRVFARRSVTNCEQSLTTGKSPRTNTRTGGFV